METKVLNEYVKDNNINGYLSNDLDSNNLQTCTTWKGKRYSFDISNAKTRPRNNNGAT